MSLPGLRGTWAPLTLAPSLLVEAQAELGAEREVGAMFLPQPAAWAVSALWDKPSAHPSLVFREYFFLCAICKTNTITFQKWKHPRTSSDWPSEREVGGDAMAGDVEETGSLLWQPMKDEK